MENVSSRSDRQHRLESVIAEYLSALDSGETINTDDWVDRHAELNPELSEFIQNQIEIDRVVRPAIEVVAQSSATLIRSCSAESDAKKSTDTDNVLTARFSSETTETAIESNVSSQSSRILGDYELVQEVGRGGMGVVFEARQRSLNRTVALKMLRLGALATEEDYQRLRNEAETAASLDHPTIVPIYEVGQQDGQPYFAMKLINGSSLDQDLEPYLNDPRAAARLILKLAEAVSHAHQRGVLHRDLKPANILLDTAGDPHITDFGLSRRIGSDSQLTQTGAILGTPSFMAPEQATGLGVLTTASDVYGLGAILYSTLTGRPPFRSDSVLTTIEQVRRESPRPPSTFGPVPKDLEAICLHCLEKEPDHRYSTASELADDLQRFHQGDPVNARAVGKVERLRRWCRRHPVTSSLSAAVAVLLCLLITGSTTAALLLVQANSTALDNLEDAITAEAKATISKDKAFEALFEARVAQARSSRLNNTIGHVVDSLSEIEKAAALIPQLKVDDLEDRRLRLRNEAIASMPLFDLKVDRQWPGHPPISEAIRVAFDPDLEHYARLEPNGVVVVESRGLEKRHRAGDIVIRNVTNNKETHRLPGLGYMLRRPEVRFSPDGGKLAVFGIGNDGGACRVVVHDLASGDVLLDVKSRTRWYDSPIDFSSDSQEFVFVNFEGQLCIHHFSSEETEKPFGDRSFASAYAIRLAPDRLSFAVGSKSAVEVIDRESGETTASFELDGWPKRVTWNSSSSLLGVANGREILLLNPARATSRRLGIEKSAIKHLFFNHQGDLLASSGLDMTTQLWDVRTGGRLLKCRQVGIAFSGDDRQLAWGTAGSSIGRWDIVFPDDGYSKLGYENVTYTNPTVSPDGRLLVAAGRTRFRLWDLAVHETIGTIAIPNVNALFFEPSGNAIWASTPEEYLRWPVEIGESTVHLGEPERIPLIAGHKLAAVSTNGRWIASVRDRSQGQLGGAVLRKARSNEEGVYLKHPSCWSVDFSPDEQWVVTCAGRGVDAKVWEVETGKLVAELPVHSDIVARFSRDGRWLATGGQHETSLWEVGTWKLKRRFPRTIPGKSSAVAFDSASRLLAVPDDIHSIKLFDVSTGNHLATFESPSELPIDSLALAGDGQSLLAIPSLGPIWVWNLPRVQKRLEPFGLDWSESSVSELKDVKPLVLKLD